MNISPRIDVVLQVLKFAESDQNYLFLEKINMNWKK
jgi:hypothetical protein